MTGQLLAVLRRPVDTIVCSVLDADPPLRVLGALAAHEPESVVAGVVALRDACGATAAVIVVDAAAPARWTRRLRAQARAGRVRVMGMVNDYPRGDPTLLLLSLSGRKLRPGRSPVEQGVVMVDAAAAGAVGRMMLGGTAMTHVPVGVCDHAVDHDPTHDRMRYVEAPVGMRVGELLGRLSLNPAVGGVRAGDLLRDRLIDDETVIGGGELVIHLLPHEPGGAVDPCIRCGWCVQGCPTNIQPAGLLEAAQREDLALAERYGLESCIECGICAFVCPSELPLLGGIRHLRALSVVGGVK